MGMTKRWRKRLRLLVQKDEVERELDEELALHLQLETEKNIVAGMVPEEARRQAAFAFGGVEKHKEEVRDARWLGWVSGLSLDLKLGWRMLAKSPGLTLIAVLGMAVGIAISASVFSVLGSVLGRSLPMDEGDRVVALTNVNVASGEDALETHLHELAVWRDELTTVGEVGAYRHATRNLIGEGPAEPLSVAEMTASGFRIARTPPLLGRYLVDEDERPGAQGVVVIGYEVWRERFGGREDIVGRTLRMSSGTHTIVGVMPKGFGFPINDDLWVPLRLDPLAFEAGKAPAIRVFGRLSRDATLGQAQTQLATIGRRLAGAQPATHEHLRPRVTHYTDEFIEAPPVRILLQSVRFLVAIILLVIAVNVAILVYARTASRTGEIAMRIALGASRARVVAQLFAEALVLSATAAVVGLLAAALLLRRLGVLAVRLGGDLPYWVDFALSPATVVYVAALTLLSAAVVGVLPALKGTNRRMQETLRQLGGATGMRMGRSWTVLIGVQAGIAVALIPLGAALQMQLMLSARSLATSASMERVMSASITMEDELSLALDPEANQGDLGARFADRRTELLRRLEAEPGIDATSFASDVPGGGMSQRWLDVEGIDPSTPPERHVANNNEVGPGFFELYGARMLAGRTLSAEGAGTSTNAAVVNQSFVESALGGGNPLGRRFRYATKLDQAAPGGIEPGGWYEVVGVVSNFPVGAARSAEGDASVYHPVAPGRLSTEMTLLVRAGGASPEAVAERIWAVTTALDPALQVSQVRSAAETARIARSGAYLMVGAVVTLISAVILLSAAGIHALVAFTVAQRRREIGVRIALGAGPRQVVGGILARAARQVAIGLGLGGLAAAALIPAVADTPGGAMLLVAVVAALLLIVGMLSALVPARHGLRIQPMEALRQE